MVVQGTVQARLCLVRTVPAAKTVKFWLRQAAMLPCNKCNNLVLGFNRLWIPPRRRRDKALVRLISPSEEVRIVMWMLATRWASHSLTSSRKFTVLSRASENHQFNNSKHPLLQRQQDSNSCKIQHLGVASIWSNKGGACFDQKFTSKKIHKSLLIFPPKI